MPRKPPTLDVGTVAELYSGLGEHRYSGWR